jgi:protein phosphatase PTC7
MLDSVKHGTIVERLKMITEIEEHYCTNGSENYQVLYKSKSQENGFNFPFQIGTHGNNPRVAESSSMTIQTGDLVILGTDGLFDNMYVFMILDELENLKKNNELNPENISKKLAEKAFYYSLKYEFFSPFSMLAMLKVATFYRGGKSDDITVSVGQISDSLKE